MFLPTVLLSNYLTRANLFAWNLDDKLIGVEKQTGVVFAGRNIEALEFTTDAVELPKSRITILTRDMHTLQTEIIFYQRVVEWSDECADFLASLTMRLLSGGGRERASYQEILESVEYLKQMAKG